MTKFLEGIKFLYVRSEKPPSLLGATSIEVIVDCSKRIYQSSEKWRKSLCYFLIEHHQGIGCK